MSEEYPQWLKLRKTGPKPTFNDPWHIMKREAARRTYYRAKYKREHPQEGIEAL